MSYFCKIPIIKQDTNLSHQLLVRQSSDHHHWNQHTQKPTCKDFQVLPGQKQLCIF